MGRLTAPAASAMSEWVNDKVAPSYWVPNSQLKVINTCVIDLCDVLALIRADDSLPIGLSHV